MKSLFKICLLGLLAGCASRVVVRDKTVFENEIGWLEAGASQGADSVRTLLTLSCKCENKGGEFDWSTVECDDAAEHVITIETQLPVIVHNARVAAGIIEGVAKNMPDVYPDAKTLCAAKAKE